MGANRIADVVGILGDIFLLVAFFLLQYDKLKPHSILYILANLIGALLILYSLFYSWNLAAVIIEIAWALISIYGIYKWFKKKKVEQ